MLVVDSEEHSERDNLALGCEFNSSPTYSVSGTAFGCIDKRTTRGAEQAPLRKAEASLRFPKASSELGESV